MKRARKVILWLFATLFLLGLIVLGTALFLLNTDVGLQLAKNSALPALNKSINGELEIGELQGSALGDLTINDVVLSDESGAPVISAKRADVKWTPSSLTGDTIAVESIELDSPVFNLALDKDGVNIAKIFAKDPPEPSTGPVELPQVDLSKATIKNGSFSLKGDDGSEIIAMSNFDTELSVRLGGPDVKADLQTFSATVSLLGKEYWVRGRAKTDVDVNKGLVARDIDLDIDNGHLDSPQIDIDFDPFAMRGQAKIDAPVDLVQKASGMQEVKASAQLDLRFDRDKDGAWTLDAKGKAAKAPVVFKGGFDESPLRVHGHFEAERLNPARVHSAAPAGRLSEVADFDITLVPLPNGTLTSKTRGILKLPVAATSTRVDIDRLDADLKLTNGLIDFDVIARAEGARLDTRGSFDPTADPLRFGRTRIDLDVPRVSRVLPQGRGRAVVTATASGALEQLLVQAHVEMDGLSMPGIKLDGLVADVDAKGVWKKPEGSGTLFARNLSFDGRTIDEVSARVEAVSTRRRSDIKIQELMISSGGLELNGGGGQFAFQSDGLIELQDLVMRTSAGSVAVSGTIAPPGWPRGKTDAQLTLKQFELAAVPPTLVPELQGYQGLVSSEVRIQRHRGQWKAQFDGDIEHLVLPADGPPIDVSLRANVLPEVVTASVALSGKGVGQLKVDAVVIPPKDPLDVDAWKTILKERPVERAQAQFSDANVTPLLEVFGATAPVKGRLSGFAAIGKDGQIATADIDARNLQIQLTETTTRAPPTADVQVKFQYDRGNGGVIVALRGGAFGRGNLEGWIEGPTNVLDYEAWTGLELQALRRIEGDFKGLEVKALLGLIEGPEEFDGRIDAKLNGGPALIPLDADIRIHSVRHSEVPGLWAANSQISLTADKLLAEIQAARDNKQVLTAAGSVPLRLDDLIAGDPALFKNRPVSARVDINDLLLEPLGALTGLKKKISGSMVATATVGGTISDPRGSLHLELKNAKLDDQDFNTFVVDGKLSQEQGTAELKITQPKGGNLDFTGAIDLARTDKPVKALLKVDKFRVDFVSGLGLIPVGVRGFMEGQMELKGPVENPEPRGRLKIHELRLIAPVPQVAPIHDGFMDLRIYDYKANFDLKGRANPGDFDMFTRIDLRDLKNIKLEGEVSTDDYPISAVLLALVTTDMKIKGEGDLKRFSVVANLLNGTIRIPEESGEQLLEIETQDDVVFVDGLPTDEEETSTVAESLFTLNLKIETEQPIQVEGNAVRARFDPDLQVKTVPAGAEIGGTITNRDGSIDLVGRQYIIERARLLFDKRVPPNPAVQVRLRHDFATHAFYVVVEGTAENPELRFETQPPGFGESELFAIFLGTDPADLNNSGGTTNPGAKAAGAVGNLLLGQVNAQLRRALPVDTIDLELGGDEFGAETKLTIGKWITAELFIAYRYIAASSSSGADARVNAHEAVVQYRFLPGWLLEVNVGDALFFGGDLFWIRRF